jgi:LemA protein
MALLILLGGLLLVGLWLLSSYNGLVAMRQRCKQAFADIEAQLKQRHDLVPNLVETVKGYAAHERGTLDHVIKARTNAATAQGAAAQGAAEGALTGAVSRLIALGEAYPDLKANQNFQQLQSELSDIENKIAAARRFFNNSASEYNAAREGVPGVFIAQRFDFAPQEFFNLDEQEREASKDAPSVKF